MRKKEEKKRGGKRGGEGGGNVLGHLSLFDLPLD